MRTWRGAWRVVQGIGNVPPIHVVSWRACNNANWLTFWRTLPRIGSSSLSCFAGYYGRRNFDGIGSASRRLFNADCRCADCRCRDPGNNELRRRQAGRCSRTGNRLRFRQTAARRQLDPAGEYGKVSQVCQAREECQRPEQENTRAGKEGAAKTGSAERTPPRRPSASRSLRA